MIFDFSHYNTKHWYPGHMLKASRQIKDKLKLVDVAIILLDARAPRSSINETLNEVLGEKARLFIFNKTDMGDDKETKAWREEFQKDGHRVVCTNILKKKNIDKIVPAVQKAVEADRKKKGTTRPLLRPIRMMIIGVPNVGKSSLINAMSSKKSAQTGPRPGVTRNQQWVRLRNDMELLDTPGIMTPSGKGKEAELRLGLTNIIKQSLIGHDNLCKYLLYQLFVTDQVHLLKIYKIDTDDINSDIMELLAKIAHARGFLLPGGEPNLEKASETMLRDFMNGKLGRMSFDRIDEDTLPNPKVHAIWSKDERDNER